MHIGFRRFVTRVSVLHSTLKNDVLFEISLMQSKCNERIKCKYVMSCLHANHLHSQGQKTNNVLPGIQEFIVLHCNIMSSSPVLELTMELRWPSKLDNGVVVLIGNLIPVTGRHRHKGIESITMQNSFNSSDIASMCMLSHNFYRRQQHPCLSV